jgi:hypothetical protein
MTAATFLERPRFRAGVVIDKNARGFAVRLRGNSCQIDTNKAARAPLRRLFARLGEGLDHGEVESAFGDFAEEAHAVIDQLDRFGYLTEGGGFRKQEDAVGSEAFLRALRQLVDGAESGGADAADAVPETFTRQLESGVARREQLVRYAVEYLHIVRNGPGLVAPVLNWVGEPTLRAQLSDFLAEEWRHDRLLAQSLAAVGMRADDVRPAEMLPQTFALLAQLGVRATTDPLALASLLYVYERSNPQFHRMYVENCHRVGLPKAFIDPVVRHASMNDAGRHDDIAAALVRHVCPVARERAVVALSDASVAVEHLRALDLALGRLDAV